MTKKLTLIWYFYKPLITINLIFSGVGLWDLYHLGTSFILFTLFIKLVGYAGCVFYKHYFSNKTYLYFLNAGYGIKKIYALAFSFDFMIYLSMVVCFYLIKWICSL